jgi:hypothetical protein
LAGLATGGRIADFVVFSLAPHVRILGSATVGAEAVRAAAGSGFVFLLFVAMVLSPIGRRAPYVAKVAAFWFVMAELLGWTLGALSPASVGPNDAARFLDVTGASSFTVGIVSVLLGLFATAGLLRASARSSSLREPRETATDPLMIA